MAFETGTATNLDDLFTKMVAFAVANASFTEITKITGTGEQSDMYILQKGSIFWWFLGGSYTVTGYGTNGLINMRMMNITPTLGNRTNTSYAQQYDTRAQLWNRYNGPFTNYWFYSNGESVQVVLEVTPSVFTHWSFGVMDKFGTWTGGEFLVGSYLHYSGGWDVGDSEWNGSISSNGSVPFNQGDISASGSKGTGFVYFPQAATGDYQDWAPIGSTTTANQRAYFTCPYVIPMSTTYIMRKLTTILLYCSPNAFNGRAGLFPTYCFLLQASTSTRAAMLGHVENVKVLNMENIDPKETVELEWDVYPIFQKAGDLSVAAVTGNVALAYKRET